MLSSMLSSIDKSKSWCYHFAVLTIPKRHVTVEKAIITMNYVLQIIIGLRIGNLAQKTIKTK